MFVAFCGDPIIALVCGAGQVFARLSGCIFLPSLMLFLVMPTHQRHECLSSFYLNVRFVFISIDSLCDISLASTGIRKIHSLHREEMLFIGIQIEDQVWSPALHSTLSISQTTVVVLEINSSYNFFPNYYLTISKLLMMMIAFITIKSSLVPLIESLCAQIYFRFEISVICSHLLLFFFVKEKTC